MYHGTTPTLTFRLKSMTIDPPTIDLSRMKQIWITIKDGFGLKHTWDIDRVTIDNDHKLIMLTLTQAETFTLAPGVGKVQIRMLTDEDVALVTKVKTINLLKVLKGGIIS